MIDMAGKLIIPAVVKYTTQLASSRQPSGLPVRRPDVVSRKECF